MENSDQDPLIIEIYYPKLTEANHYLKPDILVEVGSRSLREPYTQRAFCTMTSEIFADKSFADKPITVPVVNPERTFLEKIFLLHEEFQKVSDKVRVQRLSRHLYDIEKLSKTEHAATALQDLHLYNIIVEHRSKFNTIKGLDYANHSPDKIRFIPPDDLLPLWEKDYQVMQENMLYGKTISFGELINRLAELQKRINNMINPTDLQDQSGCIYDVNP